MVAVEIRISVGASSKEKSEKLLDLIRLPVMELLLCSNQNDTGQGVYDNSKLSVDYTVSMPPTVMLNLTNKFGDVYLNELQEREILIFLMVTLTLTNFEFQQCGEYQFRKRGYPLYNRSHGNTEIF